MTSESNSTGSRCLLTRERIGMTLTTAAGSMQVNLLVRVAQARVGAMIE
jgi:hypothetical protein